jgi:hypothetical protein
MFSSGELENLPLFFSKYQKEFKKLRELENES